LQVSGSLKLRDTILKVSFVVLFSMFGIVAAKMADKILAAFQYSGTLFEFWFSSQLLPSLD